jgi:hypothetical protein
MTDGICSQKHKVPPAYSRADDNARSLNGCRDDEFLVFPQTQKDPFISEMESFRFNAGEGLEASSPHHRLSLLRAEFEEFLAKHFSFLINFCRTFKVLIPSYEGQICGTVNKEVQFFYAQVSQFSCNLIFPSVQISINQRILLMHKRLHSFLNGAFEI